MNNNLGFGGSPSSNNSSFSSFQSPYSSTPTTNSRFPRPRFAYAGPPSYPRPRSSASKPNPDSYTRTVENSEYSNEYNVNKEGLDYSPGYMDSMRNNFGDSSMYLNDSLSVNKSRDSLYDSSSYFTCNESFYQSPSSSFENQSSTFNSPKRGGHSQFVNNINDRREDPGYSSNFVAPSYNQGQPLSNTQFGTFATNTQGPYGTFSSNTRGVRGTYGQNRGIVRGRFQKRGRGGRGKSGTEKFSKKYSAFNMAQRKSALRCEICSIDFTSQIPLDMHLRGARHAKKLKSQNALNVIQDQISQVKEVEQSDGKKFYCELCDVIANSSLQLQMHLDGVKHKNKLEQSAENKEETDVKSEKETDVKSDKETVVKSDKETVVKNDKETVVKSVKVELSSKTELNGKSNGGVTRPAPADFCELLPTKMAKYSCDICNVIVNSDTQLQQHLSSKRHQAKVEGKPLPKKPRKAPKQEDGQPTEQSQNTDETKQELATVVGVKTLSASFVQGESLQ